METLTNYYKKQLAAFINAEIKKDNGEPIRVDTDAIMDNLYRLTMCSENDIKKRWLPLHLKRMVLYILFDGAALIDTQLTQYEPEKFATATTTIVVDGKVIACASKTIAFDDVDPFAGYSDAKRNVSMVEIAKGSSETHALTKAGIGMDFIGDMLERCYVDASMEQQDDDNETVSFNPDIAANAAALLQEQNDTQGSGEDPAKKPNILYAIDGPQQGTPLSECPPKYLACLLAKIKVGKLEADEEYQKALSELVLPKHEKIYNVYLTKLGENIA